MTKLYINDGAGNFSEVQGNNPLMGVDKSSIAFSDVNGDGNKDVLITGHNNLKDPIAKLYTNDVMGNFSEMMGTPFEGVRNSSIAFADVNADGNEDVLITGINNSSEYITKLYTNDGMGNFTEVMDTPFEGVSKSSIAFSDVNADGNEDVLITGINNSSDRIAKLYTNDGTGNFIEMMGTTFVGVEYSSIAFSDVNGDGNKDVLITGENGTRDRISKLYANDGKGNFTEMMDAPFEGVSNSSIAFSDVNGDGSKDVLITGTTWINRENNIYGYITKLYTNDGKGNFTEMMDTPFDSVRYSSIAFSDVNGDGNDDVLITGSIDFSGGIAKLYTNDGMGNFTEVMDTPFEGVSNSSIAFSDVNGDGNEDVLITGFNHTSGQRSTKIYINNGKISSVDELEIGNSFDFILFPNPSAPSILYLSYDSAYNGEVTIKLYNAIGVLLSQQREFAVIGPQTLSINLNPLKTGTYFIEMDNGKKRGVARFIVK